MKYTQRSASMKSKKSKRAVSKSAIEELVSVEIDENDSEFKKSDSSND